MPARRKSVFLIESFDEITEDIITHPLFLAMRQLPHHGGENSLYIHSVATARCAYRLAKYFHLREDRVRSVTRAALLHDFFGYNWQSDRHRRYMEHYSGLEKLKHMHAFVHGAHAAHRANRVFGLSDRQCAAITSHMFPLAPLPHNSEAWVLTLADKLVASKEMGETVVFYAKQFLHTARSSAGRSRIGVGFRFCFTERKAVDEGDQPPDHQNHGENTQHPHSHDL